MVQSCSFQPGNCAGNVSVIIPVLNEAPTIWDVVTFVRRSKLTDEVLVIDDGSTDGTPEIACTAGARVITSTMLGKGVSMEDGLRLARNEILVYLDGDLKGLSGHLIERLTQPIFDMQADFVKAKFTRTAGRVTVLTARPLLRTLFPELAHFQQPLGGIIAAKRSLLSTLRFENDYGVDIGLLIDAAAAKARIMEVDIGHIDHDSQSLEALEQMATQVARTILQRAMRLRNRALARLAPIDDTQRRVLRYSDEPPNAEPIAV
jgi:glucosyl-3-phosphoglycerate synthase